MATLTSHRRAAPSAWQSWIDVGAVAPRLTRLIKFPPEWRMRGVDVARVFPGRPSGVCVEYVLHLQHKSGRKLRGCIYLTPQSELLEDGHPGPRGALRIAAALESRLRTRLAHR